MIGSIGSLWYLSRDPRFIKKVHDTITMRFERDYGLHFSGVVSALSPFTASVTFKNVAIRPIVEDGDWYIKMEEVTFAFSLIRYLFSKKIGLTMDFSAVSVGTEVRDRKVAFVEYIKKIMAQKSAPLIFELDACYCREVVLKISEKSYGLEAVGACALQVARERGVYQGKLIFKQGSVSLPTKKILTAVTGTVQVVFSDERGSSAIFDLSCAVPLLLKEEELCHLAGKWQGASGLFSCSTTGQSLQCDRIFVEITDEGLGVHTVGDVALSSCMQVVKFPYPAQVVGMCHFDIQGIVGKEIQGSVAIQNSQLAGWSIELFKTSFELKKGEAKGSVSYLQQNERLEGSWMWDPEKQKVRFGITNTTTFTLFATPWYLPERKTVLKGALSLDGHGKIAYQVVCDQSKTEALFKTHGIVECRGSDFVVTGTVLAGDTLYDVHASSKKSFPSDAGLFSLLVCEKNDLKVIPMVTIQHAQSHTGVQIELSFLQTILSQYARTDIIGQGSLVMEGLWQGSELCGTIELKDGMLRIPSIYNFIHALQARFRCNFLKRILSLQKVALSLQKGTIQSALLQVGYDPLNKGVWAHLPLVFTDCFINWKKDLYLLFSGAIIGKKNPDKRFVIEGFLALDRSRLKENIFSQKTQQMLMESWGSPSAEKKVDAHISVTTRVPLAVKTETLETNALLSLLFCAGENDPTLEGHIMLQGGAIHFPAHSLSIVKGKLTFVPAHTNDPLIEVTAQARIKKYLITLSIGGTAQDPHLVFDAIPSLSEEQIMMLLIAGSEEESLNIVAPALIMRNIENVIFGSSYRSSQDSWLEPLKRIKFIPRFTDQTGRGGFKGALEIEVSKRLRAIIEKNFSLTEDVAYQVEYLLTDDVSVRASYDERGDLGAELEMRFKF